MFRRSQDNFKSAAEENPDLEIEKLIDEHDETSNYSDYEDAKEILPVQEIIYEEEVERFVLKIRNCILFNLFACYYYLQRVN